MEPLVIPQRDEEEDFGKHLLELLGSPVSRHYNGISNLFSPDLNAGSSYELLPAGSVGSPDFTRQLNSAGLHDLNHCNGRQQQGFPTWQLPPQNLPTLQLPQHSWPGGWQAEGWLPQSPTCPVLSPLGAQLNCGNFNSSLFANGTANHANGVAYLANGNGLYHNGDAGLHIDQLLAVGEQQQQQQQQLQPSLLSPTAAAIAAPLAYAPITPQQQQLLQEMPPAVKQQQQEWLPPLKPQPQLQLVKSQPQHVQQAQQVRRPPPGVRLVAPTAPESVPPVVQQSATAGAGAALINAFGPQQQQQQQQQRQGRKRVLHLPASALRKAPRTSSSSSPSPSAAAAVATAAMGTDGHQQHMQSIPEEGGIANMASPTTPTTPTAAGLAATAAGYPGPVVGSSGWPAPRGGGQPGVGTLVWGKVNRFPWWPAVVIPPETADEPAPSADAAQAAPSDSSSKAHRYVRFLGTHDTAWLEPGKLSPWPVQLGERSSKTKAGAFVRALKEGRTYAATGTLPDVFNAELRGAVRKRQQQPQQQDSHAGSVQHDAALSGSKSPHLVGSTDSSRGASAGDSNSRSSSEQPPESSSSALRPKPEAEDAPSLVGEATAAAGAPAAGALDAVGHALAAAAVDTAGAGVGLSVPAGSAGVEAEVEAGNLPGARKESAKKAPVARPAAQRSGAAPSTGMRTSLRSARGTQQSAVEVRHTRSGRQLRG